MALEFLVRISEKMNEPKKFKLNNDITKHMLLKAGFYQRGDIYRYTKTLYRYDNSDKQPYVILILNYYDNDSELIENVCCDDGNIYIPFYNPDLRHNNRVYETIVSNYNNIMDNLVKQKILKDVRKHDG